MVGNFCFELITFDSLIYTIDHPVIVYCFVENSIGLKLVKWKLTFCYFGSSPADDAHEMSSPIFPKFSHQICHLAIMIAL